MYKFKQEQDSVNAYLVKHLFDTRVILSYCIMVIEEYTFEFDTKINTKTHL